MNLSLVFIQFVFIVSIGGSALGFGQGQVKDPAAKPAYEAGQVWSYKTRPNEKTSTLIILKVENDKELGQIVHIALSELRMKRPGGGFLTRANHLPFDKKSIDASVLKLLSKYEDLPDFMEGYNLWKEAFDAKKAGVYAITVAEAVSVMESTFNR